MLMNTRYTKCHKPKETNYTRPHVTPNTKLKTQKIQILAPTGSYPKNGSQTLVKRWRESSGAVCMLAIMTKVSFVHSSMAQHESI